MKKTALLSLFCLALLISSFSHAMWCNPETKAFMSSMTALYRALNASGDPNEARGSGLTPLQELLTKPIPKTFQADAWIFVSSHIKKILLRNPDINLINPQTGNTALGDLITHCHPTNNYITVMTKHLIEAGARLENIDSHNHCLWDLLEVARSSGALGKEKYDEIVKIPAVQQHIAAQKAWRVRATEELSEALDPFLPLDLHFMPAVYAWGTPE